MKKLAYDIILFERCNLKCEHCFEQNHCAPYGLEKLKMIPQDVYQSFVKEFEARGKQLDQLTISFCGGELFIDGDLEKRIPVYTKLIDDLKSVIRKAGYAGPILFEMISNAVHTKKDLVEQFLRSTNSNISISYDPVHRYRSAKQKQLALDNIIFYDKKDLLDEISITLTKQSIHHYIKHDDMKMFSDYSVGINYYINSNPNYVHLIPSDDDYWQFWKYCLDNGYTNVKALDQFINNIKHETKNTFCICDDRLVVRNGQITYNCVKYSSMYNDCDFYGKSEVSENSVRLIKRSLGEQKRGCVVCKYYNICPGMCWTSLLFKHAVCSERCPCATLIDYIQNSDDINHPIL